MVFVGRILNRDYLLWKTFFQLTIIDAIANHRHQSFMLASTLV